ncbi:MAG: MmcQ/YjbR family DNA-binding protein [Patescibacteria group bacterium]
MTQKELHEILIAYPRVKLEHPFGPEAAVYKVEVGEDKKMFALIAEDSDPVRLTLKCDPNLAETLRENYESVMPGYHMNKRHWNTIVLTGQLDNQQILDLIDHSYQLVA